QSMSALITLVSRRSRRSARAAPHAEGARRSEGGRGPDRSPAPGNRPRSSASEAAAVRAPHPELRGPETLRGSWCATTRLRIAHARHVVLRPRGTCERGADHLLSHRWTFPAPAPTQRSTTTSFVTLVW